jgi:hypothetical protein
MRLIKRSFSVDWRVGHCDGVLLGTMRGGNMGSVRGQIRLNNIAF